MSELTEIEIQEVWREIQRAMRAFMGDLFSGGRTDLMVTHDLRNLLERRALISLGYTPPFWKAFNEPARLRIIVAAQLPLGPVTR